MRWVYRVGAAILLGAMVAVGCSDSDPDQESVPTTDNAVVDEIVSGILTGDSDSVEAYWDTPARPCFLEGEIGLPKCADGEAKGTLVRAGIFECGKGETRYENSDFGLPEGWELYSVELDDRVGLTYRIILSPGAEADENAVELYVRTPRPGLEDVFEVSLQAYSKLCITAQEATADVNEFLIAPPDRR